MHPLTVAPVATAAHRPPTDESGPRHPPHKGLAGAGTSLVTTAPTPAIAPSPIVTLGTTVTNATSQTVRPITTGAGTNADNTQGRSIGTR